MKCPICHHAAINHLASGCIVCNCAGERDWRLDNFEVRP